VIYEAEMDLSLVSLDRLNLQRQRLLAERVQLRRIGCR
jgi:hypothetical protein